MKKLITLAALACALGVAQAKDEPHSKPAKRQPQQQEQPEKQPPKKCDRKYRELDNWMARTGKWAREKVAEFKQGK